jgi:hypothetical protein
MDVSLDSRASPEPRGFLPSTEPRARWRLDDCTMRLGHRCAVCETARRLAARTAFNRRDPPHARVAQRDIRDGAMFAHHGAMSGRALLGTVH